MWSPSTRQAVLEVVAGVALAFLLTTVLAVAAAQLWGHRGSDKPLVIALALSYVAQLACVFLLWKRQRHVAYGILGYFGFALLFMAGALTIFHRS
jgi:hypothetical protein